MHASFQSDHNPLIRKLESIFTLNDDERQALSSLPMQVLALKENQDVVREGDRPSRSCLILSGFVCVYKITGEASARSSRSTFPATFPIYKASI